MSKFVAVQISPSAWTCGTRHVVADVREVERVDLRIHAGLRERARGREVARHVADAAQLVAGGVRAGRPAVRAVGRQVAVLVELLDREEVGDRLPHRARVMAGAVGALAIMRFSIMCVYS
jgi:hypothetical protein